jgi:uncharacterized protein (TIGR02246 family)
MTDFAEIRRLYIAAYVHADATAISQVFTTDCVFLPPDAQIGSGRASVQAFYQQQFSEMKPASLTITPSEEVTMGDWGYGAGTWAVTAAMPDGATVKLEGKYLNVMKRQADGSWQIYRHSWNAPTQMAAMAAAAQR